MGLPKIIENNRRNMGSVLRELSNQYDELSIATGYWDLPGLLEIFEGIKTYKSIRLIIGQEPLAPRFARKLDLTEPEKTFPELDFTAGLQDLEQKQEFRDLVFATKQLIDDSKLHVKVYRRSFLHAKAYIFGSYNSESAVGIIGSSNFTKAGLTTNSELNTLEDDYRIVKFKPQNDTDEYGHLSWYDSIWNDELNEDWNGKFSQILQDSPVGDLSFGAYDSYIKTLMEVFPDELIKKPELGSQIKDILYAFQNRNAGILINKLEKMGVAILSDSVGLGKTITAGAVIRYYVDKGAKRIVAVVPASLKEQWRSDLAHVFGLIEGSDFMVVSQQDLGAMDRMAELDKYKQVDLFIVDEAHNLRSTGSTRYEHILEWFQDNNESKVLMLTATPINNSLMDLLNQIQLGLKGELDSVLVPYKNATNGRIETIDFFDALGRIQKRLKNDQDFDWDAVKPTLVSGIQHYLVRSTRQGVEAEGSLVDEDGNKKTFPKSIVGQIEYSYNEELTRQIADKIAGKATMLEGIDTRTIDLEQITEATSRTSHPLDFVKDMLGESTDGVIQNVFQMVTLFGFVPYKPEMYQHKLYQKTSEEVKNLGLKGVESQIINLQLTVHNMLLVTWLKRLESSTASLLKSIQTYSTRLESYRVWLERGYILSFRDIAIVEQEYGEDIERAFEDYDSYVPAEDDSNEELKRKGVEKRAADPAKYNIDAMMRDISRDKLIAGALIDVIEDLTSIENDSKLNEFAKFLEEVNSNGAHGKKVLVFSFFADTINYLRDNLPKRIQVADFSDRTEFLSGQSNSVENVVKRFSPESKKYTLKSDEKELDFLFATDILSEGQNLQDAGVLVNYDLHWNPVRMIQRNGRINRLGSKYDEVLISNMKPEDNLELYLNLVARLQKKINIIKNTVGLDQGVLSADDVNPIEFVEDLRKLYSGNKEEASNTLSELEDDKDILSWTNDHVYRLRQFLNDHTQEEIDKIKSIPEGKWNYLPSTTKQEHGKVLSLLRVDGKTSITDTPITQTFFVSTITAGEYASEVIDEFEALQNIATLPEDNERKRDNIDVERNTVARRTSRIAKIRAEAGDSVYILKPRQLDALTAVQPMFPDLALRPLLENGIKDARTKRLFESTVRLINGDIKTSGSVTASTVSKLTGLIAGLDNKEQETVKADKVTSVLNYARRTT